VDGWLIWQAVFVAAGVVCGLLGAFKVKAEVSWPLLFAVCVVIGVWGLPLWKAVLTS
jgi:hypothetical protein